MLIVLLRHGETAYNAQRRYQGVTDVPLSPEGRARLRKADFEPETVYVTPLMRTAQTAEALFPHAKQIVVPELREMDFGGFEGRTYDEMKNDPAYCAPARTERAGRRSAGGSAARLSSWQTKRLRAETSSWSLSRTAARRWRRSAALPSRAGIITAGTRRSRAALY